MGNLDLNKIKVTVGLSGGVDSSVAALLLREAGFDVRGVYLKCYWTYEGCQSDQDRNSAAKVASVLNIPFEVWDFEKEYRKTVVDYFYDEYKKGRTPNPDVVCNREIKFGLFLERALGAFGSVLGQAPKRPLSPTAKDTVGALSLAHAADYRFGVFPCRPQNSTFIATGHYARLGLVTEDSLPVTSDRGRKVIFPKFSQCESVRDSNLEKYVNIEEYLECLEHVGSFGDTGAGKCGNLSLFGGVDAMKDQSYFLYDIPPSTYEHILYPLGNLTKKQVREIAKREKLPTADRPDSTGICFIGEVNVEKFLKERISEHEGSVVNRAGEVIGKHKGVEFYTIGQRHGFAVRLANPDLSKDLLKGSPLPPSGGGVPPQRALLYKSSLYDSSSRPPYYVIGKNVKKNELIVGMGEECKTNQFLVRIDRNFQFSIFNFQLFVRIRNLGEFIPCRVTSEEAKSNRLEVTLEYSVFGIAPGQCAVFYRKWPAMGDQCPVWQVVGGGVIGAN